MNSYNLIFAGTPEFSAKTLQALIHSPHSIKAVYTQPDRPAGRGRKLTPSAVKELALQHHLPVYQPMTLRDETEQKTLAGIQADIMIVVAYGLLLPKPVLTSPRLGCINIHASLLPRWRGAAPIQRAILEGDTQTGITIMQMDEGLDTGPMLYKTICPIHPEDNSQILHDRLAELGAEAILKTLANLSKIQPEQQDNSLATYAHKLKKEEAQISWELSAQELQNKIRAFNPWPVAFFLMDNDIVRVWEAETIDSESNYSPGTIVQSSPQGIDVATGKGILRLLKLQLPGGKILAVSDILNSRKTEFAIQKILK